LGDSPTGLQRVIDRFSPFRERSFENKYIQRKKSHENPPSLEHIYKRKKNEPFKLTIKETQLSITDLNKNMVSTTSECPTQNLFVPVPEQLQNELDVGMFDPHILSSDMVSP
jgi:hypothetical protein